MKLTLFLNTSFALDAYIHVRMRLTLNCTYTSCTYQIYRVVWEIFGVKYFRMPSCMYETKHSQYFLQRKIKVVRHGDR